jgi:DNA polymerase-3 subunit chi
MTEVLFYHLERARLEQVLPELVMKCLERGWHSVIQTDTEEQADTFSSLLWSFRDDSFIPHGTARDGFSDRQAVFLTSDTQNPNRAKIRFILNGAQLKDSTDYLRIIYLFDGNNDEAVAMARKNWSEARRADYNVTYWRQNAQGKWEQKA